LRKIGGGGCNTHDIIANVSDTQIPPCLDSLKLDHLGIAVHSIAAARSLYELLGLRVAAEEDVPHEQVRTAMLPLGDTRLELLEPTAETSTIARFLTRRGEGLHHIALHTDDIAATFARLREQGIRLVDDQIRTGAGGHPYFFLHPSTSNGVLIEVVGSIPA
jgi:methylmalonyl-CoA epimerase